MIGYPIVFRCCECTVEEQTMDHLESHIWSRHLQAFPFKCAHCDFPALSATSLIEHFEHNHSDVATIEFKRNLDDEKRFRKMVAESIAIEIEDNSQQDSNSQLQPMIQQGSSQILILPSQNDQYEDIVEHRVNVDEDVFAGLDDDEHVEELIEDDDDDDYIDELGNPVFIGAHDDPGYILDDDISQQGTIRMSNGFHLKYIRTRRMDKLIENVVNSAQRISPDSTSHPSNEDPFANGQRDIIKPARYRCDQCAKSFKYQSKLVEHRRVHIGEKPYSCPYCTQNFSQKGALKTHMRTHTGERPFYCQWDCGKQFISSSARRHHEKTHSGERPYICSVCGKSFTKNSHVVRHLKNIHNRELHEAILEGDVSSAGGPSIVSSSEMRDMEPRGKELRVVHDIIEQIHEEKFSEQKGYSRL